MATPSKVPIDHPSVTQRIRPYSLVLAAIAVLALVLWSALKAFQRFPHISAWLTAREVPFGIATAAVVALAVVWKVPQWQVGKVSGLEPKERFDRVNEARKTLAQIIGGLAVLAGFYSTVQNLKVTQDNQTLAQKSFALAQEGQITDRFSKAIEQLGAVDSRGKKKLEVRLGGIYALQRIANESEEEHWPIMEVLTAYIRTNASVTEQQQRKPFLGAKLINSTAPAADIQAILTVIANRRATVENPSQTLNLCNADMSGADLSGADLSRADLSGAHLRQADLHEANLTGAHLNGTDLSGADLRGAHLNVFWTANTDLRGADLKGADLSDATFINPHLTAAFLEQANLSRANLTRANLTGAFLEDAKLTGAHLLHANLNGARLPLADLSGADLSGTDLSGADLSGTDLRGADLTLVNLNGTDLTWVRNLEQQQVDSAKGNSDTKLPSNLHMPEAWKKH